jgi:hypothetical protein
LERLQLACGEPDNSNLPGGHFTQGLSRHQLTPTRRREGTSSWVHATFWQLHAFPIFDDCILVSAVRFDLVPRLGNRPRNAAAPRSDPFEFYNEFWCGDALEQAERTPFEGSLALRRMLLGVTQHHEDQTMSEDQHLMALFALSTCWTNSFTAGFPPPSVSIRATSEPPYNRFE